MMIACIRISLALVSLCIVISSAQKKNYLIGVKYISYNIQDGKTASGQCCDEPGKTNVSCTPNLCDTAFELCGTRNPTTPCDVFARQMTPITYNNNSINFGKVIGNSANRSASLMVFKFAYQKGPIDFNITAQEMPEGNTTAAKVEIAQFNFVVNWSDPMFINPPLYRRFLLNDTQMQFVLDIVSMCSKYYFTHDCSVHCRPNKTRYTCLDNGTKSCLPGWEGPNCDKLVDHCPGNTCQHGSTCVPILLNYTCACLPNFAGKYCQIITGTTSILTTTIPTTPSTRLTNPARTFATRTFATNPTMKTKTKLASVTVQTAGTASSGSGNSKPVRPYQREDGEFMDVRVAAGVAGGLLFLIMLLTLIVYAVCRKHKREKVEPVVNPLPIYVGHVFNHVNTDYKHFRTYPPADTATWDNMPRFNKRH